ncbi:MAG TPA: PAC2 family protein [Acidimicrobiales bacterium]|nr:PAC2 family protein [Acidimicrobiales bacterium]
MSDLFELVQRPDLDAPLLVVVLEGWIDAGLGAGTAVQTILTDTPTEVVATFDTDVLLDHRARRPTLHLADGIQTGLTWPVIELRVGADPDGRDVLFLLGAEPDHTWRAFSAAVVDLAHELDVRMVTGLGAYPAPVPHTRPTRVVATTTRPELARQVGSVQGRVDVPAGVQAAIEERASDEGLPAIGLWAQVPHYASAMPYPAAGMALIQALDEVAGVQFRVGALEQESVAARSRLDELIAESAEHQQLVARLEEQVDENEARVDETGGLPSGEELVAELERFLRDQE